jgi:hypothetical protein
VRTVASHRPTTSGGPRRGSSRPCSRPGVAGTRGRQAYSTPSSRWSGRPPPGRTSSTTSRPCADGSRSTSPPPRRPAAQARPGGLRDVEFSVQLLQLVHGRPTSRCAPGPRSTGSRPSSAGGYVGREDAATLDGIPAAAHPGTPHPALPPAPHPPHAHRASDLRRLGRALGHRSSRRRPWSPSGRPSSGGAPAARADLLPARCSRPWPASPTRCA